jgi:catechol 2,3-dioxygenase-like lactoylglutathione lyase family enzyme
MMARTDLRFRRALLPLWLLALLAASGPHPTSWGTPAPGYASGALPGRTAPEGQRKLAGGNTPGHAGTPGLPSTPGLPQTSTLAGVAGGSRSEPVAAVDAIGMTVADMDRSLEFYTNVLSFEKISDVEVTGTEYEQLQGVFGVRMRVARLKLGEEAIELTEYLAPHGKPFPADSRSDDRWFQHVAIIVSDMDQAYARLRRHRVPHLSSGPQRLPDWNKKAAGIEAFYFADPDGHPLEILQFPPGKGDPKWHRPSDRLFLGIDHTAIVVGDTEASLKFYRDLLGLKVVGESENYGTEQEHLNNVFGAHLRITTLRAASGPGIEFLEYLSPRDGRSFPADERANDLVHRQTRLVTGAAGAVAQALRDGKAAFVSSGVVTLSDGDLGFRRGFLARDPDGHVVQLIEK